MRRKLSIAFQLIKRLWPYVSVEVSIFTYSDEQAAFIESVISTRTINDLCRILDCNVEDILRYIENSEDQEL